MDKNSIPNNQLGKNQSEEEEEEKDFKEEKSPYLFDLPLLNLQNYERVDRIGDGGFINEFIIIDKETHHLYLAKKFVDFKSTMFSKSATIFTQIKHPSIIKYIGYSPVDFNGSKNPMIITEYYKNGSLFDILSKLRKGHSIDGWNDTTKMITIYGIASAMSYLHHHNILYRNLTPKKILIDDNFHPIVSDLENASLLNDDDKYIIMKNNVEESYYIAPEIFSNDEYSNESDVYSFAMIMYEIFVKKDPYQNLSFRKIIRMLMENKRPKFDKEIPASIKKLIESCWYDVPQRRPSFDQITEILKSDESFIYEGVDEEMYHSYIKMIDDGVNKLSQKVDKNEIECVACNKKFENKRDIVYISGYNYHKDCIKCAICHKKLESIEKLDDDIVYIMPNFFLCKEDYEEYEKTKKLPTNALNEYQDKMIKNMINEIFKPIIFRDDEIIAKCTQKDIFIEPDMIENSYLLSNNYKYFVPTVTFHFSFSPEQINFKEFIKLLPKEMVIISIEKGSAFITIAFIISNELQITEQTYSNIIEPLKSSLNSTLGQSIVGNLIDNEPILEIPDDKRIIEFINHKSINLLQNTDVINQIDIGEIKKEIQNILLKQKNKNYEFIFDKFELFEQIEQKVREDIKNNDIEVIIIGETIIANKYYEEYEKIKEQINKNDEEEMQCFLYHGTKLANHTKIISNHFLMPGQNIIRKQNDKGYYGKGIYATDNIFYASKYSNGYKTLKPNEKISVIGCLGIYNPNHSNEIFDLTQHGLALPDDIIKSYGIHYALVGSKNNFYPITEIEKDKNFIVATEYVFPNKYQLIPLCSFTIMRTSFYILWADEKSKYSNYYDQMKKNIIENIYYVDSLEEVINISELKKRNYIKLIISYEDIEWAKNIIKIVRKIYQSDIVCMIFDIDSKYIEFATSNKNVLFTNEISILQEFANINMNINSLRKYIEKLGKQQLFKIDNSSILNFNIIKKFK